MLTFAGCWAKSVSGGVRVRDGGDILELGDVAALSSGRMSSIREADREARRRDAGREARAAGGSSDVFTPFSEHEGVAAVLLLGMPATRRRIEERLRSAHLVISAPDPRIALIVNESGEVVVAKMSWPSFFTNPFDTVMSPDTQTGVLSNVPLTSAAPRWKIAIGVCW